MNPKQREIISNSFIYSNFNYCPLVWNFSPKSASRKIEKIHERCLRMKLKNYTGTYKEILNLAGEVTMDTRRLRLLLVQVFKTIHDENPHYMKEIFQVSQGTARNRNNLKVHSHITANYGTKSLKTLAPQIWNSLPEHIKASKSLSCF